MKSYDCIVVGAGHAGCEAAFAAAGLAWEIRPDRVTPEQFALIAENLA